MIFCKRNRETYPEAVPSGFPDRRTSGTDPWSADAWLVEIPESFSKFSNVLIAPIMAALLFGVTINRKKVVGYLDYICVEQGIYGMQMAVGAALGALLAVLWPGLPKGWGTMGSLFLHRCLQRSCRLT